MLKALLASAVLLVPAVSVQAGWLTTIIALDAADEATKARVAAERAQRAARAGDGSFCEIPARDVCPGCAIHCHDGVPAICSESMRKVQDCSPPTCIRQAICRCGTADRKGDE